MFNPIDIKGGRIFREIARAMPDRCFAAVPGWHSLRRNDGSWDEEVIRRSCESQRGRLDWTPEEIDLSDLPNVKILTPRDEVSEIYAQTRILVVPSLWQETLARVSIEALANGIPVIGSAVGGLKEHLSIAGLLVKDKTDVEAWVEAIKMLDDPKAYAELSEKGRSFVTNHYSAKKTALDFLLVFNRVTARGHFSAE